MTNKLAKRKAKNNTDAMRHYEAQEYTPMMLQFSQGIARKRMESTQKSLSYWPEHREET